VLAFLADWCIVAVAALITWRVLLPRFDRELDQEERDREV
jgi:hypothetical protein